MILTIFLLCGRIFQWKKQQAHISWVFRLGTIQHILTIRCFTCTDREQGHFCSTPFVIDAGEENNENDINSHIYAPDYICQVRI